MVIQSNGKLGTVWIGPQFCEDKKNKVLPSGKSLELHSKTLVNLSDKMETDLECQVQDELHAKNLKAMLRGRFHEE